MSSLTTILPPVRLLPSSSSSTSIPLKQDNFSDGEGDDEGENVDRGKGNEEEGEVFERTLLIKHLGLIVMKCHP